MSAQSHRVTIRSGDRVLVSVRDYPVHQNRVAFLFGESGIGKSIIAKALAGLLDPAELGGEVDGRSYAAYRGLPEVKALRENGFFVFQEPSSHLNPLTRIIDQLREGSLEKSPGEGEALSRLWSSEGPEQARALLSVYPKPYRPSGGEKQRALLTMAFKKIERHVESGDSLRPTFFVFDEPTGSLDNRFRNVFLEMLLEKFAKRPFTALVITHDYSIISEIQARHPSRLADVCYLELIRDPDSGVRVREFLPQEYLTWIGGTQKAKPAAAEAAAVLKVQSQFSVFGRSLGIYGDPARQEPRDLLIRKGEMAYVKAGSGVGKTTLAKVVLGLYRPDRFRMELCGMPLDEKTETTLFRDRIWGRKASMVFQHADEALNLQSTVFETFRGLPLRKKMDRQTLRRELAVLFKGEIVDAFLDKRTGTLSGGQKQRLNLLRTLLLQTDLVILDEPLNGLDFESIKRVLVLLEEKRQQGCALLMISHNEEIFDSIVHSASVYHLG